MALLINLFQLLIMLSLFSPSNDSMFPELEGYQKNEKIEIYNPDNLYDIINGAADSYLKYDFEELKLARYKGDKNQTLKIEIYRHSNSANAFGIYSNERPIKGNWVDVGAQGYYERSILNFCKGKYYIKLSSYKINNNQKLLLKTANLVADNLEGNNGLPKVLTAFPKEGKIDHSGRYIDKNFLGYKSLTEAFTMDYGVNGQDFRLFLIQKDDINASRKMLEDYFSSIKMDKKFINEGNIKVKDTYQGEINILWMGNNVIGVLNCSEAELGEKYLEAMNKNLEMN